MRTVVLAIGHEHVLYHERLCVSATCRMFDRSCAASIGHDIPGAWESSQHGRFGEERTVAYSAVPRSLTVLSSVFVLACAALFHLALPRAVRAQDAPATVDEHTVALLRLDEMQGGTAGDASGHARHAALEKRFADPEWYEHGRFLDHRPVAEHALCATRSQSLACPAACSVGCLTVSFTLVMGTSGNDASS